MPVSHPPAEDVFLPNTYTVDTLPAAGEAVLGKYAKVSDLFGEKFDVVLCSKVGTQFFWQPVRPLHSKRMPLNAGDVTLTSLKSPSVVIGTGTLSTDRNIVLSDTMAYPGASFEVGFQGTITVGTISVKTQAGVVLNTLLAGGHRRFFYTDNTWNSF